jgi:hypothetical protein
MEHAPSVIIDGGSLAILPSLTLMGYKRLTPMGETKAWRKKQGTTDF